MATLQTFAIPNINTTAFTTLTRDIMESIVNSDTSPFKDAKLLVEDYLLDATDLDATQKAGVFSGFLQDSYAQVNQQAINAAIDILKTNAQLELEAKASEVDYFLKQAQAEKIGEDDLLTQEQILQARGQRLELEAKLKKQYGYSAATVGNHTDTAASLGTSSADGALDKQIDGYTKVNYKDLLKSNNENIALLQNAGVAPSPWQVDVSKLLIEMISDGKIDVRTITGDDPRTDEIETSYTDVDYETPGTVDGIKDAT